MGFQDDVNDLKSVSFDLLYSQVSSLVSSYNELNFSGEKSEAFKSSLALLHNTIGSMRNLIKNVEDFEQLNNNYTDSTKFDNSNDDLADFISNSESASVNNDNFSTGLIFNDVSKDVEREEVVPIGNDSNVNLADNNSLISNVGNVDNNTESVALVEDNSNSMANDDSTVVSVDENSITDSSNSEVNVRAIDVLSKFYKNSDKPVKAIIVNDSQYNKLLASNREQASLLDFGVNDSSSNVVSIESMIEKATNLYNRGEKEAAEKLYDQINNMLLVKKSA